MRQQLGDNQKRVMDLIHRAVEAGGPAPSNADIGNCCGVLPADGHAVLVSLVAKGLIGVSYDRTIRILTIVATGQSIRAVPVMRGSHKQPYDDGYRGPVPEHLLVDRDPCPRCGVRADIGCEHGRRAA